MRPPMLAKIVASLLLFPSTLALGDPLSDPLQAQLQNDAGSGRDAGRSPADAVPVLPGVLYRADIHRDVLRDGLVFGDYEDWYSFDAPAGALLDLRLSGVEGCLRLRDDVGAELVNSCEATGDAKEAVILRALERGGRYHVSYDSVVDQEYAFSFALDGFAPSPLSVRTPLPADDAGSGRDAGNDARDPLPVAAGVAYGGFAGTLDDPADWYSIGLAAGDRLELRAAGAIGCYHVHRPDGADAGLVCGDGYADLRPFSLVADATGAWMVAYSPLQPERYFFSLGVNAPAPAPFVDTRLETYTVPSQDDAGSGRDAGDAPFDAVAIAPGAAYRGHGSLQDIDWYSFQATAGQSIRLPVSGLYVCLTLYDPDLARVADSCAVGYAYTDGGGDWTASSTGTWRIRAEALGSQPYSFALGLDADPPAPQPPVGAP
jgi:hypothetical protein